ncbi:hypothetical protein IQ230_23470 [Gloeocapsopsis crepidinum LEGE 06123]|uniref:Uncharacterized protein n=1 Tax=Gloeocapsopsis crepidinum LEGE 06123 TaxID=588587 RepID=A0ABR9UZ28_9CHRO|nr:hypothetical protein [Gloeocapsopsis crepidinum]MBE9193250.1 hypothetical protein [Gloeocapsopsis crepidinum LEGE 06123]
MAISISLSSLASRATRKVAAGNSGIRRIALNATTAVQEDDNPVASVYNAIEKFGQSLMRNTLQAFIDVFKFSWSKFWAQFVKTGLFLMNFNWNSTDQQLDEQIKQAEIALAASRGALAGQSLGFAICGLIPTATIAVFNEPLALYMLKELGEEAADEIASSLANMITLQLDVQVKRGFTALFKNYRTLLRGAAINFANILVRMGRLTQESVDKANENRNKPWSFAGAFEESIDSIEDPIEQAYTEEFWDEFQESCIEAGFIIAGAADSYFAAQKLANQSLVGDYGVVTIEPIRDNEAVTVDTNATSSP